MSHSAENADPMITRMAPMIAGALVSGSALFLIVALVVRGAGGQGWFAADPWDVMPPKGLISLLGVGFGAMASALAFVLPRQIVAGVRRTLAREKAGETPLGALHAAYQTQMIVGLAILEGAAFFNGIAYLIEGHAPNLIVAGVLIALMLAKFPTPSGIAGWVEDQAARVRDERPFA